MLLDMPPLADPLALRLMRDDEVHHNPCDDYERAYRPSFLLDPGAVNPLPHGKCGRGVHDLGQGYGLRVTVMRGGDGYAAHALAIVQKAGAGGPVPGSGTSFVFTKVPGCIEYYLRPAVYDGRSALPEGRLALLTTALRMRLPLRANRTLRALRTLWARGPDTEDGTLWV